MATISEALAIAVQHRQAGRLPAAEQIYRRVLAVAPDHADAHFKLGNTLRDQGKTNEAVACYRRALELKPDFVNAHNNLGNSFRSLGKLDDAIACYRRILELKPDFVEAHSNLGSVYTQQGNLDEAVACYRRALELKPEIAGTYSNLVYTLIFHPDYDSRTIYEEHLSWNKQFAVPLATLTQPHSNERTSGRRLRIGYVSSDFREHVVGFNLLPLFREHDHHQFEVFCYAHVRRPDLTTSLFQNYADNWRNVVGITDESLAQIIREDRIDILVDLTLHMALNRLLVFARKPAPVQVTFAGYPGTTGLTAIDYRLTDLYLDPPEFNDHNYSEKSVRLPDTFWCYDSITNGPAVNRLPAHEKGYITFGNLNNFIKINASVLELWAQVLKAVDRSQILIRAAEGSHRQHTLDFLEQQGVSPSRVNFVGNQSRLQYLELYHRIDIGLDTFPYNGHTTSLDSFWMGVPVITTVGRTVVGRAGLSQLMNLGLSELIAETPEQFVRVAVELANDLPRLTELRATLRHRMMNSPLMDAPRFTQNIEAAYRMMWQNWCDNKTLFE